MHIEFSLEVIHWNHTYHYSENSHFSKKIDWILFYKFLQSIHYMRVWTDLDVYLNLPGMQRHTTVRH